MKKLATLCMALVCFQGLFAHDLITREDGTDVKTEVIEESFDDSTDGATLAQDLKYRQLKTMYNYKDYDKSAGKVYSPGWSGVASLFVPGLGQMICAEPGRGFRYLGGHLAGMIVAQTILSMGEDEGGNVSDGAAIGALAVYAGVVALDICSIFDAVRVAKVKTMYNQDLRRLQAFDINLYPSLKAVPMGEGVQTAAGLTLAINF